MSLSETESDTLYFLWPGLLASQAWQLARFTCFCKHGNMPLPSASRPIPLCSRLAWLTGAASSFRSDSLKHSKWL